jgi:amidohydrolase
MKNSIKLILIGVVLLVPYLGISNAQSSKLEQKANAAADKIEQKVIEWRHHIHQNPELGNREFETAKMIAKHLKSLGMEVQEGVAHTGVVGLLKGGKPGPVVALRADIDALPVTERTDIPFASKVTTEYNGAQTGVMHACGHDTHVAILMGVAEVLAEMKKDLKGSVKFIFQPAEEGPPAGEEGGAELMVKEGVLVNPKVDAIFGLHINSQTEIGKIAYRSGGIMAAVSDFKITVKGKSSHGAAPWNSVDPIVISAQIINSLQTIVSRNIQLTENPAVVTIGAIHGGNRSNIIPEEVEMLGTLRTLKKEDQDLSYKRIKMIAENTAKAMGGTAIVEIPYSASYPVTFNDPELTKKMASSLEKVVGKENLIIINPITGAEDFSFFQENVPGLYFFVGGMPKGQDEKTAAPHHTPEFFIDNSGMIYGVKAFTTLVLDYLN